MGRVVITLEEVMKLEGVMNLQKTIGEAVIMRWLEQKREGVKEGQGSDLV